MNVQTDYFISDPILPDSKDRELTIDFSFYGLGCRLYFDNPKLSAKLIHLLPPYHQLLKNRSPEQIFRLITIMGEEANGLFWNDERILQFQSIDETVFEAIESKIQYLMAAALPPKMYLLHAGAISIGEIGILIPGNSFSGKTTLTREFLKAGAEYFSDDCAIIDQNGMLYPYSKTLSIRNGFEQGKIVEAESIGAKMASQPVPVRLIILAEYAEGSTWINSEITQGKAVWELSKNLFFPTTMTLYPKETLQTLANVANRSKTFYGKRGEAREVVRQVLTEIERLNRN